MDERLNIVVTGAGGGVGSCISRCFLDKSCNVIAIDVGAMPSDASCRISFDLSDIHNKFAWSELANSIERQLVPKQRLVIINCAATQMLSPLSDLDSALVDHSWRVNVAGPQLLLSALYPLMVESGGGVINILSIHSQLSKPLFSTYAATKAALESLTRSWALELAADGLFSRGVRLAAIDTPMLHKGFNYDQNKLKDLEQFHPARQIGDPSKVAEFIQRMCLDDNFLNGCIVDYDGAISCRLHDPI